MVAVRKPLPSAVTADLIAQAVVASARVYGEDPAGAVAADPIRDYARRRCLAPALRAICEVTDAPIGRIACILRLSRNGLAQRSDRDAVTVRAHQAAVAACRAHMPAVPVRQPPKPRPAAAVTPPPPPPSRFRQTGFSQLDRISGVGQPHQEVRPRLSDGDRALIEAAIAAGKVTRLEPGHAAGLSAMERHLHAAPPPRPEGRGWGSTGNCRNGAAAATRQRELQK